MNAQTERATPGPWTAESKGGRGAWIKGSTGEWAALACGDTDRRAIENAHLIAAAPDLRDALLRAADHVCSLTCSSVRNDGEDFTHSADCMAVTAALAKASPTETEKQP